MGYTHAFTACLKPNKDFIQKTLEKDTASSNKKQTTTAAIRQNSNRNHTTTRHDKRQLHSIATLIANNTATEKKANKNRQT